jgi:hypothetical protein
VLTVGEHIAIVQRAQAIAATDHGALVRAQRELAEARAEIKRLRRRARRIGNQRAAGPRAPAVMRASDRGVDRAAIFSIGAQVPGRGQHKPLERLAARPSPLSRGFVARSGMASCSTGCRLDDDGTQACCRGA